MEKNDFNDIDLDLNEIINDFSPNFETNSATSGNEEDNYAEINPSEPVELEDIEDKPLPVRKKSKNKKTSASVLTVFRRICIFLIITGVLCVAGGLGVEYVLVKGPSPTLSQQFVLTMLETRRFGFLAGIFLTDEELAAAQATHYQEYDVSADASLITIGGSESEYSDEAPLPGEEDDDVYRIVDEDGDGIVVDRIKRSGFEGYMMMVLDPTRVSVSTTRYLRSTGETLTSMCQRTDSIAGINAGGFDDEGGNGIGGYPLGLTAANGEYFNTGADPAYFVGFDSTGIMHMGYYTASDVYSLGITNGVTFGPTLVVNGQARSEAELASGLNPRTAIGQRADGVVLMLVIDGRQVQSLGATYADVAEIMVEYGAVNAINLDGGSSSVMYFEDKVINSCSAGAGERALPTAFLVSRESK